MLAILYIFLIIVFLIIIKQFYFSDSEYFHPIDPNANRNSSEHSHTRAAQITKSIPKVKFKAKHDVHLDHQPMNPLKKLRCFNR